MVANPTRRAELADAGLRVLAEAGARGLTHRAVDRAAGVPLGTAANYFRTRDAMLGALADRIFDRLAPSPERLARLAAPPATLESSIAHIRDIVERTTAAPELMLALFELRLEGARRPELATILRATLHGSFRADVEYNTQAGLPGAAREIALLHFAIDGLLLDRLTTSIGDDLDTETAVGELVRRILQPTVP